MEHGLFSNEPHTFKEHVILWGHRDRKRSQTMRHVLLMLSCIAILIAQAWQHIPVPAIGRQGKEDSIQSHLGICNKTLS